MKINLVSLLFRRSNRSFSRTRCRLSSTATEEDLYTPSASTSVDDRWKSWNFWSTRYHVPLIHVSRVFRYSCIAETPKYAWNNERVYVFFLLAFLIALTRWLPRVFSMKSSSGHECGIDHSVQMVSYATAIRKGIEWYGKLGVQLLLGISAVNAWTVYKIATRKVANIRRFRELLAAKEFKGNSSLLSKLPRRTSAFYRMLWSFTF